MFSRMIRNVAAGAGLLLQPLLALAQETLARNAQGEVVGLGVDYAVVFPAMLLGLALLVVVFLLIGRANRARYETVKLMIEKGQEIPPEFFAPHRPHALPKEGLTLDYYRGMAIGWGVTWTCLGLGISAASYVSSGQLRSAAWGLIFVFLGLGSFINAAIVHWQIKKQAATPKP